MNRAHSDDDRYLAVFNQANELLSGKCEINEAAIMLDEIRLHREFFESWFGKDSPEFLLTNALLNLVRMINRSLTSKMAMGSMKLDDWSKALPIRIEWVKKLKDLVANQ